MLDKGKPRNLQHHNFFRGLKYHICSKDWEIIGCEQNPTLFNLL